MNVFHSEVINPLTQMLTLDWLVFFVFFSVNVIFQAFGTFVLASAFWPGGCWLSLSAVWVPSCPIAACGLHGAGGRTTHNRTETLNYSDNNSWFMQFSHRTQEAASQDSHIPRMPRVTWCFLTTSSSSSLFPFSPLFVCFPDVFI